MIGFPPFQTRVRSARRGEAWRGIERYSIPRYPYRRHVSGSGRARAVRRQSGAGVPARVPAAVVGGRVRRQRIAASAPALPLPTHTSTSSKPSSAPTAHSCPPAAHQLPNSCPTAAQQLPTSCPPCYPLVTTRRDTSSSDQQLVILRQHKGGTKVKGRNKS